MDDSENIELNSTSSHGIMNELELGVNEVFIDEKVSDISTMSEDASTKVWVGPEYFKKNSWYYIFCYYWTGLVNNEVHKFRFMKYMAELEALQTNTFFTQRREADIKLYKELEGKDGNDEISVDTLLSSTNDDISNTFHELEHFLKVYADLIWVTNSPMEPFLKKYFETRNKVCSLVEFNFMSTFGCGGGGPDETVYCHYKYNDFKIIDDEVNRSNKYLKTYLAYGQRKTVNLDRILYNTRSLQELKKKRADDLNMVLSQLGAISEFIKLSVDINDQLPFKLFVMFSNLVIMIGEYVWNTTLKHRYA